MPNDKFERQYKMLLNEIGRFNKQNISMDEFALKDFARIWVVSDPKIVDVLYNRWSHNVEMDVQLIRGIMRNHNRDASTYQNSDIDVAVKSITRWSPCRNKEELVQAARQIKLELLKSGNVVKKSD